MPGLLGSSSQWLAAIARVARAKRWPDHRGEAVDPFFIIGPPRSGNTLVRRILVASPGVHIPPELPTLPAAIRAFQRYRFLQWDMLTGAVLWKLRAFPLYKHWGLDLGPLYERLRRAPPEQCSLAFIVDSLFRFHAEQTGQPCTRWGDKTPMNRYAIEEILQVFPRAKFVFLMRDGVDVVRSILQDLHESGFYDLPKAAAEWVKSIATARRLQSLFPGLTHELRYEKLVTEPVPTSRALFEFLGLPFDPSVVERTDHTEKMGDIPAAHWHANVQKPIFTGSIGKGRREFSPDEKRTLQGVFAGALEREGYPPATEP